MCANVLNCQYFAKNMSLTITLKLNHLLWRVWCLDLCSEIKESDGTNYFNL